jgi:hypothetical protein
MAIIIFVIVLVYFTFGKISEENFIQVLFTVYGLYVGGNVTTKFLRKE